MIILILLRNCLFRNIAIEIHNKTLLYVNNDPQ